LSSKQSGEGGGNAVQYGGYGSWYCTTRGIPGLTSAHSLEQQGISDICTQDIQISVIDHGGTYLRLSSLTDTLHGTPFMRTDDLLLKYSKMEQCLSI